MKITTLLSISLLGALAAPALAHDLAFATGEGEGEQAVAPARAERALEQRAGLAARRNGKVVKNLPYSAEVITERQQNLADGNQISTKTSSFSYRDSAGRTRQEFHNARGELTAISIIDPVGDASYTLNPRTKTAVHLPAPGQLIGPALQAARARIEQLRKEGKLPPERNEIILRRSEDDNDNVHIVVDGKAPIRVEAASMSSSGLNPRELTLGPLGGAFADIKWSNKSSVRELGTREIEGLRAEGRVRSYDIPAGEVGNRNPIVVSDESWYAPELQITVLTRHSDPRSGENTYRIASLKREEPAAALFTVPADYTVKDPIENIRAAAEKKRETPAR